MNVTKYDASLMRVNYGIKFEHYNLTGRKDKLKIFLINGYTRNISAYYSAPYSNPKLTKGFDGVELRGFPGRIDAEEHADDGR